MSWIPHITVAAVTERDGNFLMVEESVGGKAVYNQPAGHLEENETLIEAVVRETLEETAMRFIPEHLLGVYHWRQTNSRDTYIRIAFTGLIDGDKQAQPLSKGVLGTTWLPHKQLLALPENKLRSPMVLRCIEDYHAAIRYPLSAVSCLNDNL